MAYKLRVHLANRGKQIEAENCGKYLKIVDPRATFPFSSEIPQHIEVQEGYFQMRGRFVSLCTS